TSHDRPSKSKLRYKARVFKVGRLLDTKLNDAYVVCFETGGVCDYNDAIYLLTNANAWRIPDARPQEEKRWTLKELRKALEIPEE
ncbi:MAG TPA: hypothetical protein VIM57_03090, partial [Luteolibacter sp.]